MNFKGAVVDVVRSLISAVCFIFVYSEIDVWVDRGNQFLLQ